MDDENKHQDKKNYYFDLKEAATDIGLALGAKEKSIASAKLFGKTLFNTALFSGRAVIKTGKEALEQKEKHINTDDDKLKKLKEKGNIAERMAASSILKEREAEN